jgi:hypothetical protein
MWGKVGHETCHLNETKLGQNQEANYTLSNMAMEKHGKTIFIEDVPIKTSICRVFCPPAMFAYQRANILKLEVGLQLLPLS